MNNEQKNDDSIVSTEDQLEATKTCEKILQATGCDYLISLFPANDGSEEITRGSVHLPNLVGHFNSVAEQTAKRLGIPREKALIKMAEAGSMTTRSINLN